MQELGETRGGGTLRSELTTVERVAKVTLFINARRQFSARDVARVGECSRQNAYRLLDCLSRVLPIYHDSQAAVFRNIALE